MSERRMLNPTPEPLDDTPNRPGGVFPERSGRSLAAGLKTVGQVRETADETLLSFQDLGKASVAHLRETLGLQPPNLTPRRETTDIPTLLSADIPTLFSADILALLLQPPFVHRMLWNIGI